MVRRFAAFAFVLLLILVGMKAWWGAPAKSSCDGAVAKFVTDIESEDFFGFGEKQAELWRIVGPMSYSEVESELVRCKITSHFSQRGIIMHTRHANFHIQYDEARRASTVIPTKAVKYPD